ncbi:MAG: Abi-alpha family protein [Jatrophihabitans sp.]
MTAGSADDASSRPRPRPGPKPAAETAVPPPIAATKPATGQSRNQGRKRRQYGWSLARQEPQQPTQVVASAGSAIVTVARVGRLLGRSYWNIAKQIPMVSAVEHQAQRLRQTAATEMLRLLDMPQGKFSSATPEEQRVMMLVHTAGEDSAPLRTAMTELLDRSSEANDAASRDYLFGTIVSQLVPDEARILAALGGGRTFATVDVISRQGTRSISRIVLSNTSTVGAAASVALPENVGTYLTRLAGYGLLHFGRAEEELSSQYDTLAEDDRVRAARAAADAGRQGNSKLVRKTVALSPLGEEFWAACAPTDQGLERRR